MSSRSYQSVRLARFSTTDHMENTYHLHHLGFLPNCCYLYFIPETKNRTVSAPLTSQENLTNVLSIARGIGRNLRSQEPKKALYSKEEDGNGQRPQCHRHRRCDLNNSRTELLLKLFQNIYVY